MKAKLVVIDQGLVFDGFLFATHLDRCRYIGTPVRNRPQWLKNNPGAWRRIADVQQEADSLRRRVECVGPVEAVAAGPSSHTSSPDLRNDGEQNAGSVDVPAGGPSPPQQRVPLAVAAPTAFELEDEVSIDGRRCV